MTNQTPSTRHLTRTSTAVGAALLVLGSLTLGACSKVGPTDTAVGAAAPAEQAAGAPQAAAARQPVADGDTVELVSAALENPDSNDTAHAAAPDRKGLRARLVRALRATWVTESSNGAVTHQAIRGEVTAVSSTSITVKAKDGFSLTLAVGKDTTVRRRAHGKGAASTIGAIKVGSKALVTGVGDTDPTARVVVFRY
ncbi:hypothetical protein [Terrabacter sp. 2RAF25]|uniref:hypothetical protein n=1 Tax=Terrabacter sp. 2RAF25 TaxID=3232998 RepID=UPI003F9B3C03